MKTKIEKTIKGITKEMIAACLIGLAIGALLMYIIIPKRVAKLNNGEEVAITVGKYNITANDVYNDLKDKYATSAIFDLVDKTYLESKYEVTETDEESIRNNAQYYYDQYAQYYGKSKEDFLKENGFYTEDKFLDYLRIDFLRSLFYNDYLEKNVPESDIESYYNNNVFGSFNVEHILVQTSSTTTDEDAKTLATTILNEINNGLSFDEAKNKYSSQITAESFEVSFDSNLETAFFEDAKNLNANEISKNLTKTSYGYHIIYKKDVNEKPTIQAVKNRILNILTKELSSKTEYSYERVLIEMRKEAGMDIIDSDIKNEYKKYTKSINNSEE